jgi:hypothetical protein
MRGSGGDARATRVPSVVPVAYIGVMSDGVALVMRRGVDEPARLPIPGSVGPEYVVT